MCLFLFSQVIYGPRRGPTFNNRWWNDRREWNLRISIREGQGVPKGGEQHPVLLLFAPFGDGRESISYPQVPFPSVIPPAVIHIRPLRGRQLGCPIAFFSSFFPKLLYPFYTAFRPFIPFPPFIIPLQSYFPKHLETLLLFLNFASLFKMESGSFGNNLPIYLQQNLIFIL
mgnify:FL=1